ncbi:TRAP transporter small permease [Oceanospirillaceae bacterium]|nr:TRAP transporter small permease [Oceanospirillaceae bacterium]
MSSSQSNGRALTSGPFMQLILQRILGGLAATFLLTLMLLTLVDVVGRYGFNMPVSGSYEITELLLAAIIFSALPLVSANDQHITVDLIDSFVPSFIAWVRDISVALVMGLILAGISYKVWLKALESVRYGDRTAMLYLPTAPVYFYISIALGISCVVVLLLTWQYFRAGMLPSSKKA